MIEPSWVYRLNPTVAVEDFGDRSLVLHCKDLRFTELNASARDLISRLDGQANLSEVSATMAEDYGQPLSTILDDTRMTINQLAELGVVERVE